jgi:RNA polymerase sigma factor (sigma-70 family)
MMGNGETNWAGLRSLLVERYDELRRRLTRRLGSADVARETLHELYLRMDGRDSAGTLRDPTSYLLTSAMNLARDRWRTENRRAQRIDVDVLDDLVDETPTPDRIVEGRSVFEALRRAIDQLTPRQREILIAVRFERITPSEIAQRLNISSRLVRIELQRALVYCQQSLTKKS